MGHLIEAGASLVGGGGGGTQVLEFPDGRRVDAAQCWEVTIMFLLHFI